MDGKPPIGVRRILRREVGFGCPVPGCGSPYLSWHHFDPPWRVREHHEPAGMIALCGKHHDKADVGAYTVEQLRAFKVSSRDRTMELQGRFDWMRNRLLAVVGGNFYYEYPVIFRFRNEPSIWFNRDEDGYLLLNIRMLTSSGEPRLRLEDNFWFGRGEPQDFECPPSGRLIQAKYLNGDELRIEYFDLPSAGAIIKRYPETRPEEWDIEFPITAVEVQTTVGGTKIRFGPRFTSLPGENLIQNSFMRGGGTAISLN